MTHELEMMQKAIDAAELVRCVTSPKPWVGCVIQANDGDLFIGSTFETGIDHAEIIALKKAGEKARGATVFVTLEPCSHQGTTPPCADALISAGVTKVVIGIEDVDTKVSGRGIKKLCEAGIKVEVGILENEISRQLAPYVKHRKTRMPYVILKVGMTIDGFIADKQGKSQWITGDLARADVHKLRAQSDAILVGSGTIQKDDPSLTVRGHKYLGLREDLLSDPLRVAFGSVDADAKINPCQQMTGPLEIVLKDLGNQGVMQLLVEGGASVAHDFHTAGLIDRYVFYVAPAIFGGSDALSVFGGDNSPLLDDLWRGEFVNVEQLGSDLRIDCVVKES